MRLRLIALLACAGLLAAQEAVPEGPTSEKAQKTYREALDLLHHRMTEAALDSFKKADKQDGGHCPACQKQVIKYALELHDWKSAETSDTEIIAEEKTPKNLAQAHNNLGAVQLHEGNHKQK